MKQNQDQDKPRYSTLHYGVREQLSISWTEYVLLDMIYHLSAKYGHCSKSIRTISKDLGQPLSTTHRTIQNLIDRELLVKAEGGFKCATAYIDCAYLEKAPSVPKRDSRTKTGQPKRSKMRKSVPKRDGVSQNEKNNSSAELHNNNNRNIDKVNTNVLTGDESPGEFKEIVSTLYYQVVKSLDVPIRNHDNLRAKIADMARDKDREKIHQYLLFMRDQFKDLYWDMKPMIQEALDIHAKRAAIRNTFAEYLRSQRQGDAKHFKLAREKR